jgi:phosphoglycolate phosphatase
MHNTVIFDMDGTLINTSKGIFATANYTMKALGFEELPESQLRKFVGPPLPSCFRIACGLDENLIESACDIYRDEYIKGNMYLGDVYPGIESLLDTLTQKGITLGVATLKTEEMAINILKEKGLFSYFSSIKGADINDKLTKAQIIRNVLDALNISDYATVMMVGDTPHDGDGAVAVGVDFLGVDWGFGYHKGHKIEEGPFILGTIDSAHQVLDYL